LLSLIEVIIARRLRLTLVRIRNDTTQKLIPGVIRYFFNKGQLFIRENNIAIFCYSLNVDNQWVFPHPGAGAIVNAYSAEEFGFALDTPFATLGQRLGQYDFFRYFLRSIRTGRMNHDT